MESILLSALTPVVEWQEAALYDLGDGIACFEFRSKSNSISQGVSKALTQTLDECMDGFDGLVIGNQAKNFSVGADLTRMRELCEGENHAEFRIISQRGQTLYGRIKAYEKPVVAAPYRHTLGGGLELALHCHRRVVHQDLRMGLVEAGVGLLPGGGGVKETALYALSQPEQQQEQAFMTGFEKLICKQKSADAAEAFELGYLTEGDVVVEALDNLLSEAKAVCRAMPPREPYRQPMVCLPGSVLYRPMMERARQLTVQGDLGQYDLVIAQEIATILTGGDCTPCLCTEEDLLLAERAGFAALGRNPKTYERIVYLLEHGSLLSN